MPYASKYILYLTTVKAYRVVTRVLVCSDPVLTEGFKGGMGIIIPEIISYYLLSFLSFIDMVSEPFALMNEHIERNKKCCSGK